MSGPNVTENIWEREWFAFRSLFYMIHPSETYYKEAEDVPDITARAGNMFLVFMLVEQVFFLILHGRLNVRASDFVGSISAGIIHALPNVLSRNLALVSYEYIYKNFLVYEIPFDSVFTYIITFLWVDMMYYWFHRAAHEVNLFWAAHQTHHSSEDYNLSTALRQSIFQKYTSWFFYLPLALFVRPSIYMVHTHLVLLYQFWIHTELIDNIGPLEYVLNTASHHRVHHGRNPYCIDKNYAGVLIIWDRMFGTFAAESKTEKVAYGLVHPVDSFNPFYLQVFNYQYLLKKFWETETISGKLSVLFKGPGWVPGSPRLGNFEDLPQVENPIQIKGIPLPTWLNVYCLSHFFFVFVAFFEFVKNDQGYPGIVLSIIICSIMFNLQCFGQFFDAKKSAAFYDLLRSVLSIGACFHYEKIVRQLLLNSNELFIAFFWLNTVSPLIAIGLSVKLYFYKQDLGLKTSVQTDENNNLVKKTD